MSRAAGPRRRAQETLDRVIADARQEAMVRLPPVARLASLAGVCKNTMQSVVRRTAASGCLSVRQGTGIHILPDTGVPRIEPRGERRRSGFRWHRVARQLRRDVVGGVFGDSAVPAAPQLAQRYGVSVPTMRKALARLLHDGVLLTRGARYTRALPAAGPHATILLLARGELHTDRSGTEAVLAPVSARNAENLRALEQYCTRLRVRLQHVPCHFERSTIRAGLGATEMERLLRGRAVVGAQLWGAALPVGAVSQLVQMVAGRAFPVAVLDETGALDQAAIHLHSPLLSLHFLACTASDGLAVGRYLLERGHQRIAFIADWLEQRWCAERLAGLQRAFEEAGMGGAVEVFSVGESGDAQREQRAMEAVRASLTRALSMQVGRTDTRRTVSGGSPPLFDDIRNAVFRAMLRRRLQPAFRRALARSQLTCWVGATDAIALEALGYLRAQRVAVPDTVSVVGFDNTIETAFRGLTSYDFNGPALVRAMVDRLLGGSPPAVDAVSSVDGFVVERRTVRRW